MSYVYSGEYELPDGDFVVGAGPLDCGCYEGEGCPECQADNDDAWIAEMESRLVWEAAQ